MSSIYHIIPLIPAFMKYMSMLIECLAIKQHQAVVIPIDLDIKKVIANLDPNNQIVFINLDEEVKNIVEASLHNPKELRHIDQTQLLDLPNSKEYYQKSREAVLSIISLLENGCISKGKELVFISSDYHLIKSAFLSNVKILYTIPSSAYASTSFEDPNVQRDKPKFNLIVKDLKQRKSDKLHVYNNHSELEAIIMSKYKQATRKI